MRRASFLLLGLLTGCSLLSAYTITFTTPEGTVVDPAVNTLDFVISAPALAYISAVECEGSKDLDLLPVLTDDMKVQTAYNLPLTALVGQLAGAECDITVTAFDQSTTSNSRATITVVMAGEPVVEEEEAVEEETVEEPVVEETPVVEESTIVSDCATLDADLAAAMGCPAPVEETPAE